MDHSKDVITIAKEYKLSPDAVAFAFLVASGKFKRYEAFALIFNQRTKSNATLQRFARDYMKENSSLPRLIADLEFEKVNPPSSAKNWIEYNDLKRAGNQNLSNNRKKDGEMTGWNENLSVAENLKKIINEELPALEGKEKIDAGSKYAKIIGVDLERPVLTHYYLPLSCKNCSLYNTYNAHNP